MARSGITILRFAGIPVRAHWSLALGLPFFAWIMASEYFGTTAEGWAWGAALAVGLFVSVTVHEFAHSLLALRLGGTVREILLLPIGGASIMTTAPRRPKDEFLVAVVGPGASLVLGAALLLGARIAGVAWTSPAAVPPAQGFLLAAGYLNVSLGLFNLLVPAFPMDGGRALRALLARRMGIARATRIAATVGRGFALLMGFAGLLGGNLLLVLIAVFVWSGAGAEEQSVRVTSALEGVRLRDLMTREPVTLPPEASLEEALRVMLASKHLVLPVVDASGRVVGVLPSSAVAERTPAERMALRVAEVARQEFPRRRADEPAADVLPLVGEEGLVAVVDADGRLEGIVTATDVVRTVQLLGLSRSAGP